MSIQGQGHSLILAQGHSDMNFVFLRNHWAIFTKFYKKGQGNEN